MNRTYSPLSLHGVSRSLALGLVLGYTSPVPRNAICCRPRSGIARSDIILQHVCILQFITMTVVRFGEIRPAAVDNPT